MLYIDVPIYFLFNHIVIKKKKIVFDDIYILY